MGQKMFARGERFVYQLASSENVLVLLDGSAFLIWSVSEDSGCQRIMRRLKVVGADTMNTDVAPVEDKVLTVHQHSSHWSPCWKNCKTISGRRREQMQVSTTSLA